MKLQDEINLITKGFQFKCNQLEEENSQLKSKINRISDEIKQKNNKSNEIEKEEFYESASNLFNSINSNDNELCTNQNYSNSFECHEKPDIFKNSSSLFKSGHFNDNGLIFKWFLQPRMLLSKRTRS
ncbi:hypothetical protein M9Y10_002919 [Tritrichomonas musculus]|uniref:Uncharacterized protein n=1 Tax=Tritrichomonas musculus TaxID=1915356 RepID=A0ABR2LD52_9EUKA